MLRPPRSTLFPYTTLFRSQPSSAIATQIITPAIQVTVLDSLGNTDPNFTAAVTFGSVLPRLDRKSTRLNSSHGSISYAVFCLKKKKDTETKTTSAAMLQKT